MHLRRFSDFSHHYFPHLECISHFSAGNYFDRVGLSPGNLDSAVLIPSAFIAGQRPLRQQPAAKFLGLCWTVNCIYL